MVHNKPKCSKKKNVLKCSKNLGLSWPYCTVWAMSRESKWEQVLKKKSVKDTDNLYGVYPPVLKCSKKNDWIQRSCQMF